MSFIKINNEKATDRAALVKLCPFGAIEDKGGKLEINAGCRMCRMCIKKGGGVFELVEDDAAPSVDKSKWRGVAVVAEVDADGVDAQPVADPYEQTMRLERNAPGARPHCYLQTQLRKNFPITQ